MNNFFFAAAARTLLAISLVLPITGQAQSTTQVRFQTTLGHFVVELYPAKAPKTVQNFVQYAQDKHFDGTIFHRVIDGFMVQGGGMSVGMKEKKTGDKLENEANNGLTNDCYTVAMARTSDPHSATSQFFINVKDNDFLNHSAPTGSGWGYAVFGKVVAGTEVVDAICKVKTGRKGFHDDVPKEDVIIDKAVLLS